MIIDEILDNRYEDMVRFEDLDLDYIKAEAEVFDFDYLVKAIDSGNKQEIIEALETYLYDNKYDDLEIRFI